MPNNQFHQKTEPEVKPKPNKAVALTFPRVRRFKLDESWQCECGQLHTFGAYVAAHWYEALTHTCEQCGRTHTVRSGTVILNSD